MSYVQCLVLYCDTECLYAMCLYSECCGAEKGGPQVSTMKHSVRLYIATCFTWAVFTQTNGCCKNALDSNSDYTCIGLFEHSSTNSKHFICISSP